jgi:hypothetical protein
MSDVPKKFMSDVPKKFMSDPERYGSENPTSDLMSIRIL